VGLASARATGLEAQIAAKLMSARSPAELQTAQRLFESLRITRLACQIQLREKSVPFACYQVYLLERALGLHKQRQEQARLMRELDALCSETASKLNVPAFPLENLSANCRQQVQTARSIQRYRELPSSPTDRTDGPNFELR